MMSKLNIRSIAALAMLAFGCSVSAPVNAYASLAMFGDFMHMEDGRGDQELAGGIICLVLLPLCLLDKKMGEKVVFTKADLVAEGYSSEEADKLIKEQNEFFSSLYAQHLRLSITDKDTSASLSSDIRSVDPNVSDDYVKLLTDSAAVK